MNERSTPLLRVVIFVTTGGYRAALGLDGRGRPFPHEQQLADFEIHRAASRDFLPGRRSLGHDHARWAGLGDRNGRGLRLAGQRRPKHANFAGLDAGIL